MKIKILLAALMLTTAPAWAINKCTGPDGKISYQDSDCPDGKGETLKISEDSSAGDYPSYGYGSSSYGGSRNSAGAVQTGRSSGDNTIHTGPRGGHFRYTSSGSKAYVGKGKR